MDPYRFPIMEWVIPGKLPPALIERTLNETCAIPNDSIAFKTVPNFKIDDSRNEV
jgi:hypothetical protein